MVKKIKDYLDDIPETKPIQLCEYCEKESTTLLHDVLGNEIFVCDDHKSN